MVTSQPTNHINQLITQPRTKRASKQTLTEQEAPAAALHSPFIKVPGRQDDPVVDPGAVDLAVHPRTQHDGLAEAFLVLIRHKGCDVKAEAFQLLHSFVIAGSTKHSRTTVATAAPVEVLVSLEIRSTV